MLASNSFLLLSLALPTLLQASIIPSSPIISQSIKETFALLSREGEAPSDYLKLMLFKKIDNYHRENIQETKPAVIESAQKPLLLPSNQAHSPSHQDLEPSFNPKCTEGNDASFPASLFENIIQHFCSVAKQYITLDPKNPLFTKEYGASLIPDRETDGGDGAVQRSTATEFSISRVYGNGDSAKDCEEEVKLWDERVCESMFWLLVDGCDVGDLGKRGGSVVDGGRCLSYGVRVWHPVA